MELQFFFFISSISVFRFKTIKQASLHLASRALTQASSLDNVPKIDWRTESIKQSPFVRLFAQVKYFALLGQVSSRIVCAFKSCSARLKLGFPKECTCWSKWVWASLHFASKASQLELFFKNLSNSLCRHDNNWASPLKELRSFVKRVVQYLARFGSAFS